MRLFKPKRDLQDALAKEPGQPGYFRFWPVCLPAGFKCPLTGELVRFTVNTKAEELHTDFEGQLVSTPYQQGDEVPVKNPRLDEVLEFLKAEPRTAFDAHLEGAQGRGLYVVWDGVVIGPALSVNHTKGINGPVTYFRVQDAHGGWWSGRGPGVNQLCRLKPMNPPRD